MGKTRYNDFRIKFKDKNGQEKKATVITDLPEDELPQLLTWDYEVTSSGVVLV